MIKCSIVVWLIVSFFVLGLLMLPKPYNHFLWLPYALAMSFGIRWMSRKQQAIKEQVLESS